VKPVVTEQTGKKYKGIMLLGGLGVGVGVVMLIAGAAPLLSVGTVTGGLLVYFCARAGAWWNHG